MSSIIKRLQNLIFRMFSYISRIPTNDKVVFLTFDDGPEPGITEFVLNELDKYGFKATFFCRGDNAEMNHALFSMIRERGHAIGNHTYSHLHAYDTSSTDYIKDVERADSILQTNLFRPPHGSLTLRSWLRIKKRKIVFWSLNSGDSDMGRFRFEHAIDNLRNNTHSGDIILFHFCHKHDKETRKILPVYLQWLSLNGYKTEVII